MTIERFGGIPVRGYMGPLPGGGYRGITDELDALVVEAADLLREEYDRDIVIRFNSDRRSGGAWLKDEPTNDTLIGLTAGLRYIRPPEMTDDEWFDLHKDGRYGRVDHPQTIVITTVVAVTALRDPALATDGRYHADPADDRPYSYVTHDSLLDGMIWLGQNAAVPA